MFLTFDGLRDAKVRDRYTRIRIALKGPQAARLWRLLGERLTDEEKQGDCPSARFLSTVESLVGSAVYRWRTMFAPLPVS